MFDNNHFPPATMTVSTPMTCHLVRPIDDRPRETAGDVLTIVLGVICMGVTTLATLVAFGVSFG